MPLNAPVFSAWAKFILKECTDIVDPQSGENMELDREVFHDPELHLRLSSFLSSFDCGFPAGPRFRVWAVYGKVISKAMRNDIPRIIIKVE